ncbi:hypothetical protein HGB13_02750 [bacterium]|nr:hypothetical protein [bacterium]
MVIDETGQLWSTGRQSYNLSSTPFYGCLGRNSGSYWLPTWGSAMSGSLAGKSVTQAATSSTVSYAIDSTGAVHAVGSNQNGYLGIPSVPSGSSLNYITSWQATSVTNARKVIFAGAGYVLKDDNTLWVTSGNTWVQVGDALLNDASKPVIDIVSGSGVLALREDGSMVGYGGSLGATWTLQSINLLR